MATVRKATKSTSLPPEKFLICGRKSEVKIATVTSSRTIQNENDANELIANTIAAAELKCRRMCNRYIASYKCKNTCPDKSSSIIEVPSQSGDFSRVQEGNRLTVTVTKRKRAQVSCKMILRPSVKKTSAIKK